MGNMFSPSFEAREKNMLRRKDEINSRKSRIAMNDAKYKVNKESLMSNVKQFVQQKKSQIDPASQQLEQHTKLLNRIARGGGGGGGGGGGRNRAFQNAARQFGGNGY